MPATGFYPREIRVQILTLWAMEVGIPEISSLLDIPNRTISAIIKKAKDRGYKPKESFRIRAEFVEDGKCASRPKVVSKATEQAVLASTTRDRNGREKSSEILAFEAGISHSSVLRILKKHGFIIAKPSWKPGLTKAAKAKRLKFCLDHQFWTLKDWKSVIFTDETSIALGHRQGAIRVWRTVADRHNPTCIRRRWKGISDFIVWGCFTYNKKGPLHIFEPESTQQRRQSEREIEALNEELEPIFREEWEINMRMNRLHLRGVPGRIPKWNWNEKNGKLSRRGKGGVDWYRYQKV